jgi:hypothetical protein
MTDALTRTFVVRMNDPRKQQSDDHDVDVVSCSNVARHVEVVDLFQSRKTVCTHTLIGVRTST